MEILANKYKIITMNFPNEPEKNEFIEVGTLFKVAGISGCGFDLEPISKSITTNGWSLNFTPEMIKAAFTETDYPG